MNAKLCMMLAHELSEVECSRCGEVCPRRDAEIISNAMLCRGCASLRDYEYEPTGFQEQKAPIRDFMLFACGSFGMLGFFAVLTAVFN